MYPRVISIRKLAALDIAFHGSKPILAEFAIGVLLPLALGLVSLFRSHGRWQAAVGIYLVLLSINYVPLIVYAVMLTRNGTARQEVAGELAQRDLIASKYMRQSLWLLVPLVIPATALSQELR